MKKELCKQPNRTPSEQDRLYECQCESPGQCPIYNKFLGPTLHSMCQNSQEFRDTYLTIQQYAQTYALPEVAEKRRKAREEAEKAAAQFELAVEELKSEGLSLQEEEVGESEGLGDTVEKVLSKFGITTKLMEKVSGITNCRCKERKKWLNKIFPYGNNKKEKD